MLALVFARLTKALPDAGGAVGFVHAAFGHIPAFLVGWVYVISNLTAIVTLAVTAISYLSSMVPAVTASSFLPAILAIGVLWTMTLLKLRGIRFFQPVMWWLQKKSYGSDLASGGGFTDLRGIGSAEPTRQAPSAPQYSWTLAAPNRFPPDARLDRAIRYCGTLAAMSH